MVLQIIESLIALAVVQKNSAVEISPLFVFGEVEIEGFPSGREPRFVEGGPDVERIRVGRNDMLVLGEDFTRIDIIVLGCKEKPVPVISAVPKNQYPKTSSSFDRSALFRSGYGRSELFRSGLLPSPL